MIWISFEPSTTEVRRKYDGNPSRRRRRK